MSAPASADEHSAARSFAGRHRIRLWESIPGARELPSTLPSALSRIRPERLVTILFAISLDLALGYAGIVTLGHAAFFGGRRLYRGDAGLPQHLERADHRTCRGAVVAGAVGYASGLVLLRTTGLTLLMLTLCTMALLEESANLGGEFTGGFVACRACHPPTFGLFEFNPLYRGCSTS